MLASECYEVGSPKTLRPCYCRIFSGRKQQMKHLKIPLAALLAFVIAPCLVTLNGSAKTQTQSTALERGYRTGYSDGYNAGFKDVADHATRDYQSKDEYQRADRSYNQVWGTQEDYRDGYQQGFESGYAAGYDQQPFNSTIPNRLERRTTTENQTRTTT